jgi:perosamine synthetase
LFSDDPSAFIPLHAPAFHGNEKAYLNECIDSTFVSSVGPFVDRIEKEMASFTGSAHAIACVNGTAALHISLLLAGVQKGDLVLTQSLSFVATANAIAYTGAEPLFLDIDPKNLSLSAEAVAQFLRDECSLNPRKECVHNASGRRVKAIVPMHSFGFCADVKTLQDLAQEHGLALIEDAAESLGSYIDGKHSGTFGMFGTLSFNGNKTITAGGGGIILTQDAELAKKAKHLTTQAKQPHAWKFFHDQTGYNYRMPNINAALLCAQLEQLPAFLKVKRDLAQQYHSLIETFKQSQQLNLSFLQEPQGQTCNYWLCGMLTDNLEQRDQFLEQANALNFMCRPAWELLHTLPMFKRSPRAEQLDQSQFIYERLVSLPSSPYHLA